jgi:hypothetical protein
VAVYMHASAYAANVTMIQHTLLEWYSAAPAGGLVVMGHFNFVHCSALDRRHVPPSPGQQLLQPPAMQQQLLRVQQQQHGGDMPQPKPHQLHSGPSATRDTAIATTWAAHLPGLKDAWRERHPLHRAFTYVHPSAASRLDRVCVTSSMLPQAAAYRHEERQPSLSDHILVVLQVLQHGPGVMGPGLRRLRLTCQSDTCRRQQLATWLSTQQVPHDPQLWSSGGRPSNASCG